MTAAELKISAQAEEDLIEIWTYVAYHNAAAADRLLERIQSRWDLLTTQPRSGAPRNDLGAEIRHLVVGNYLSLYRVDGDRLTILRVLHGKRKITPDDLTN